MTKTIAIAAYTFAAGAFTQAAIEYINREYPNNPVYIKVLTPLAVGAAWPLVAAIGLVALPLGHNKTEPPQGLKAVK